MSSLARILMLSLAVALALPFATRVEAAPSQESATVVGLDVDTLVEQLANFPLPETRANFLREVDTFTNDLPPEQQVRLYKSLLVALDNPRNHSGTYALSLAAISIAATAKTAHYATKGKFTAGLVTLFIAGGSLLAAGMKGYEWAQLDEELGHLRREINGLLVAAESLCKAHAIN